ncbi:unnamed protein product, partial [Ixodes pacificus]
IIKARAFRRHHSEIKCRHYLNTGAASSPRVESSSASPKCDDMLHGGPSLLTGSDYFRIGRVHSDHKVITTETIFRAIHSFTSSVSRAFGRSVIQTQSNYLSVPFTILRFSLQRRILLLF